MDGKAKAAPAERPAPKVREPEATFASGETLGERLERLDSELAAQRASLGARGELGAAPETLAPPPATGEEEQQEASVGLDKLCCVAFDSLAVVQAFLYSSAAGVPYSELHRVATLDQAEKARLSQVVQKITAKYSALSAAHKELVELGLALTAVQGTALDNWLRTVPSGWPPEDKSRSLWESILICLVFFAPVLLLVVLAVLKHFERK